VRSAANKNEDEQERRRRKKRKRRREGETSYGNNTSKLWGDRK